MQVEHGARVDEALQAIMNAFLAMREATVPAWLHLDLTMGQLKSIFLLATNRTMTIGELGASLGIGRPGASILVDHLVQLGLVQREEDRGDRRRTLVYLTPQGQEMEAQLRQGRDAMMREWLSRLTADDLAALTQGLRGLSAVIAGEREELGQATQRK